MGLEHKTYSIAEDSLVYPDLLTEANRITGAAWPDFAGADVRLERPWGPDDGTWYLSFLVRPEGILGKGRNNGFFGVELCSPANALVFIGQPGHGQVNKYVIEDTGGLEQVPSGIEARVGEDALLVVKAEFAGGACKLTLFVNPRPGLPEPADGVVKECEIAFPTRLALHSTGAHSLDEIRVGRTFSEVTPASKN